MDTKTSWDKVGQWYDRLVGEEGHYYHENVILPNLKRLLGKYESIVDFGCGQGVLTSIIEPNIKYTGIDLSPHLIKIATEKDKSPKHRYFVADATSKIPDIYPADRVVMVLSLQNMKSPYKAVRNATKCLKDDGRMVIVINHPCFRIPKHSDWYEEAGRRFRVEDKYMSNLEIPIDSSPYDNRNNQTTYSYHFPLSAISEMLTDNGLVISSMEEWVSPKKSTGIKAKIEDESRKEFPMFLTIVAMKKTKM